MSTNNSSSGTVRPVLGSVSFTDVKIDDSFWTARQRSIASSTIPLCLQKIEETGRVLNFRKAAGKVEGTFEGEMFNDSDVYKVLEGIAYVLHNEPNLELETAADRIIDDIAEAQEVDGYINTYFTLMRPRDKWSDMSYHEDYCIGHLIEAGLAYSDATGKNKLLEVAHRAASHMVNRFLGKGIHWVCGHEEVELALVKLSKKTKESKFLDLAQFFLEERGCGHGKGEYWQRPGWGPSYCQDDLPVSQITRVAGHAVRAMFLFTGMAELLAVTGREDYLSALKTVWTNVTGTRLYITGGIGSSKANEGFTNDFDLPNASAYCETCASAGMIFWNHQMNLLTGDAAYADVLEQELYNGLISGLSLSGDRFFYENPLESDGNHHRSPWYNVSCCPTQLARVVPSIGKYIFSYNEAGFSINQYIGCSAAFQVGNDPVSISVATQYPWNGRVNIRLLETPARAFEIRLRVPGWSRDFSLSINGEEVRQTVMENGYLILERYWRPGDHVQFDIKMQTDVLVAHQAVAADNQLAALRRGPVVYCFEHTDNARHWESLCISDATAFVVGDESSLNISAKHISVIDRMSGHTFKAIPYCYWDEREPGPMKVWVADHRTRTALYTRS